VGYQFDCEDEEPRAVEFDSNIPTNLVITRPKPKVIVVKRNKALPKMRSMARSFSVLSLKSGASGSDQPEEQPSSRLRKAKSKIWFSSSFKKEETAKPTALPRDSTINQLAIALTKRMDRKLQEVVDQKEAKQKEKRQKIDDVMNKDI
jgi:hypothetical protein